MSEFIALINQPHATAEDSVALALQRGIKKGPSELRLKEAHYMAAAQASPYELVRPTLAWEGHEIGEVRVVLSSMLGENQASIAQSGDHMLLVQA